MSKRARRNFAARLGLVLSGLSLLCYGFRFHTLTFLPCDLRWVGMMVALVAVLVSGAALRRERVSACEHAEAGETGRGASRHSTLFAFSVTVGVALGYCVFAFWVVKVEEVRFHNGSVELSGALYTPWGGDTHPAVVLIHGSGASERKEYRVYADHFARHGIAALIYDKRGLGASMGQWRRANYKTLAQDALSGLHFLQTRRDIQADRIGLWGFSQGGWIAPLAATLSQDVAFVIMVSGPGVTPKEQVHYQWANLLREQGLDENHIEEVIALRQRIVRYWLDRKDWARLNADLQRARHQPWFAGIARRNGLWASIPPPQAITPRNDPVVPWMRDEEFDPAAALEKLTVPVLAVFGGRDRLIPVKGSRVRIEAALTKEGNSDFTIKVFPEANHGLRVQYGPHWLLPPFLAPGYMNTVTDWIRQRVGAER